MGLTALAYTTEAIKQEDKDMNDTTENTEVKKTIKTTTNKKSSRITKRVRNVISAAALTAWTIGMTLWPEAGSQFY